MMDACKHIEYIPHDLWCSHLKSLQQLIIMNCEDLVSVGAPEGIAHIPKVHIADCPKLKEVEQPLVRGCFSGRYGTSFSCVFAYLCMYVSFFLVLIYILLASYVIIIL
jgi:hypothetical protein